MQSTFGQKEEASPFIIVHLNKSDSHIANEAFEVKSNHNEGEARKKVSQKEIDFKMSKNVNNEYNGYIPKNARHAQSVLSQHSSLSYYSAKARAKSNMAHGVAITEEDDDDDYSG